MNLLKQFLVTKDQSQPEDQDEDEDFDDDSSADEDMCENLNSELQNQQ